MTPQVALLELLERAAIARGAAAFVNEDELSRWPSAAVAEMKAKQLLKRGQPASNVVCINCEEECLRPVYVLSDAGLDPTAFVVCHLRSDTNRVDIPISRIAQWHTTGELIADVLAQLLGVSRTTAAANDREWIIGTLKGRKHKSLVTLRADNDLHLLLAGHNIPLADVLTFDQNGLTADKNRLIRNVDKPAGNSETPSARRKRLKARIAEEKAEGRRAFLRTVAAEEGISVQRLKQLIYAKPAPADTWPTLTGRKNALARKK